MFARVLVPKLSLLPWYMIIGSPFSSRRGRTLAKSTKAYYLQLQKGLILAALVLLTS